MTPRLKARFHDNPHDVHRPPCRTVLEVDARETIPGKTPMNRKRWLLAIVFVAIVVGVFAILPRSPNHPQPKDFWPPASQYLAAHPDQAGDSRDTSQYVRMRDGVRITVTTPMPSS